MTQPQRRSRCRIARAGFGRSGAALTVVTTATLIAVIWGRYVQHREPRVNLGAAPFVGAWKLRLTWRIVPALALGAFVVWGAIPFARKIRFWAVVLGGGAFAAAFALALAASDGKAALLRPVTHRSEYWANLATLPSAGEMLRTFASREFMSGRSVHLKGHPPGFILLLKAMAAVGLKRPLYIGALSFVGIAVMVPAVLLTVRAMADETTARAVAPWMIVAPYAVWAGTSADAFFSAVVAVGVAITAIATRPMTADPVAPQGRRPARTAIAGLLAGSTLGWALFLSYGVVPMLVLPVVVVCARYVRDHDTRLLLTFCVSGVVGVVLVVAAFWHSGFWWLDGLATTKRYYWDGTAHWRPWPYFLLANLVVLGVAVGPAVVAGLAAPQRHVGVRSVAQAVVAAVLLADLSQYSKGEVERIWLLFMPWLMIAAAPLGSWRRPRWWLAAQVALTIGLQISLVSKW